MDLVEVHAVAAVVGARLPEAQFTAFEHLADDLGDVAHAIVLGAVADVEHLGVHDVTRRLERARDRLCDVERVHERSPRRPVADHRDPVRRPRESGQVVQDDVEPHARRGAERGRVAQEGRRERVAGELDEVALDEHLALAVRGLRIDG